MYEIERELGLRHVIQDGYLVHPVLSALRVVLSLLIPFLSVVAIVFALLRTILLQNLLLHMFQ